MYAPPSKIGIIGGSGLDDPDIIQNRKEVEVDTPFGKVLYLLGRGYGIKKHGNGSIILVDKVSLVVWTGETIGPVQEEMPCNQEFIESIVQVETRVTCLECDTLANKIGHVDHVVVLLSETFSLCDTDLFSSSVL